MNRFALVTILMLPLVAVAQSDYRQEPALENVSYGYADVLRVDPVYRTSVVREPREECREEAGIPPDLAARAVEVGRIDYCMESAEGLKPDVQFCFDLELPADFTPENADGETESFELCRRHA